MMHKTELVRRKCDQFSSSCFNIVLDGVAPGAFRYRLTSKRVKSDGSKMKFMDREPEIQEPDVAPKKASLINTAGSTIQ